jgi:hypothetical protein
VRFSVDIFAVALAPKLYAKADEIFKNTKDVLYSITIHIYRFILYGGSRGSVVVKAPCYKPEERGFDTR